MIPTDNYLEGIRHKVNICYLLKLLRSIRYLLTKNVPSKTTPADQYNLHVHTNNQVQDFPVRNRSLRVVSSNYVPLKMFHLFFVSLFGCQQFSSYSGAILSFRERENRARPRITHFRPHRVYECSNLPQIIDSSSTTAVAHSLRLCSDTYIVV